jgi:K+-sensing histidine kinase KdpD
MERTILREQDKNMLYLLYIFGGVIIISILLFIAIKVNRIMALGKNGQPLLQYGYKDAERAVEELKDLSSYESMTELPLTSVIRPNELCSHLTGVIQAHCKKGVSVAFQTKLPDSAEITTNADDLRKLLRLLLEQSARLTYKGVIKLHIADDHEYIRFSVADTSSNFGKGLKKHILGVFSEQGNKIRYIGMNFTVCMSITRLLKGRIWLDKEYADGNCFFVLIPKDPTQV